MFNKKQSNIDIALDDATLTAIQEMVGYEVTDENYAIAKKNVMELMKLRETHKPKQLSPDAILAASVNLAGILAILHYERVHVVTSKALAFVMKLR